MDLTETMKSGNRHPWEISRADCIIDLIKKYNINTVADIGAGDRFFTSKLAKIVSGNVYAVDTGYSEKEDHIDGIYCLNDISALPEIILGDFGGVVLMDVIEHIENEDIFLKTILKKIPDGAFLFITVPAFYFLFSSHDLFLKHYRRYSRKSLLSILSCQEVYIEKCYYFYASLFLVRYITLLFKNKNSCQTGIGEWLFSNTHIITRLFYVMLNIDFRVCSFLARFRIYLPGLSLLAICKKKKRRA